MTISLLEPRASLLGPVNATRRIRRLPRRNLLHQRAERLVLQRREAEAKRDALLATKTAAFGAATTGTEHNAAVAMGMQHVQLAMRARDGLAEVECQVAALDAEMHAVEVETVDLLAELARSRTSSVDRIDTRPPGRVVTSQPCLPRAGDPSAPSSFRVRVGRDA